MDRAKGGNRLLGRVIMRVYAVSDVHADFAPNMAWVRALRRGVRGEDTLILAGDVTDDLSRLEEVFFELRSAFARVVFVPGNHELWVRGNGTSDSFQKLRAVLELARDCGVAVGPVKLGVPGRGGAPEASVWIVPLLSWYVKPEEGAGSLFLPKQGEDPSLETWSDTYFVRWPRFGLEERPADRLLRMNEPFLARGYDAPVISFSHFLPRAELIVGPHVDRDRVADPFPEFNFSRVAGCSQLDEQIRRLGSRVHVYGHQHRNRDVVLDGVRYVSNCRGYPRERELGFLSREGPDLVPVWDSRSPERLGEPASVELGAPA